jgi:AhpD family alkylhydroperoxidase
MMSLNTKENEMVLLGASVAAGCKPCTNFHFKQVREAGAADEEIRRAVEYAVNIRLEATTIMENQALKLLRVVQKPVANGTDNTNRMKELVSIAAAFAINDTTSLEMHVATGKSLGLTHEDIKTAMDAALIIKLTAASHVDKIAIQYDNSADTGPEYANSSSCGTDNANVDASSCCCSSQQELGATPAGRCC